MFRRLAAVGLSSALSLTLLTVVAPSPVEATGTCPGPSIKRTIGGVDLCVQQFTSDQTWTVPAWISSIDVLLIGGGASGKVDRSDGGAGGAAGRLVIQENLSLAGVDELKFVIGSGGSGVPGGSDSYGNAGGTTFVYDWTGGSLVSTLKSATGGSTSSVSEKVGSGSGRTIPGDNGTTSGGLAVSSFNGNCGGGSAGQITGAGGGGGTGGQGASGDGFNGGFSGCLGVGGNGGYAYNAKTWLGDNNDRLLGDGGGGTGKGSGGSRGGAGGRGKGGIGEGGSTGSTSATSGVPNTGSGGGGGLASTSGAGGSGFVAIRFAPLVKTLSLSAGGGAAPSSSAASGVVLGTQPSVQLMDGLNPDAVSGVVVTASAGGASCALNPGPTATATTDASGVATFENLALDGTAGVNCTLTFEDTSPGGYGPVTSGNILMSIGPAVAGNSTVSVADASLQVALPGNTSAVSVQLKDSGENSLTATEYSAFGPYEVALSVSGAAGSVGAVTNNSDGTYSAVFTGGTETGTSTVGGSLSLGSGATGTAGSLVADTVSMTPGVKAALAIGTEPAAGAAYSGQVLGTPPVVNVVDAFGNTVTSATDAVTAAVTLVSGSGSPSLGGTNPKPAVAGVATFTDLAVTGNATSTYQLDFTASGLTGVSSSTFALAREPQSVPWVSGSSASKVFGDSPFVVSARALDASSAETGLPVTFASSNEAVCTVSGAQNPNAGTNTYSATVTVTGAGGGGGSCVVTASQAGDDDYAPASSSGLTFTVARANQSSLSIFSGTSAVFGTDLTLSGGGGSSSADLSWGTSLGPCTVSGSGTTGSLTPTGVGTCVVTLNRAADSNYNAASQVTQSVTIAKRDQVVSFTSLVPTAPKSFQTYTAEFSSSLGASYVPSVSVTTGDGTVCSRVDNGDGTALVSFLAAGTCTLTATEGGDANSNSGAATQTIVVDSINQNITFNPIADQVFGVPPIQLAASTSSGRAVTYTSSTTSVCTVGASSGLLTIVDKGTCTVTVSRAADAQYAAANSIARSFQVAAALPTAPHISSVSPGDTTITVSFTAPGFTGAPSEVIAGYEVTATPTSGSAITQSCSDVTAPLVCTMTGLANGTDYRITVAAVNSSGVGASSNVSSLLRPATAANAVTGAYAVPGINGTSVHLYWDQLPNTVATLGGGTFTSYDVYVREVGGAWPGTPEFTTSTISVVDNNFTGLTTGQSYEFKIVAITSANSTALTGNTTIVTEYPSTVPGAVTELTLTETSDTSAVITWEVPITNGGAEITSYDVAVPGLRNCAIDPATESNRCVFTGMDLGQTYTFTVTATNRMGEGPGARVSMTTPPPPSPNYDGPAVTDQTIPSEVLTGAVSWMVTENGRPVTTNLRPNNNKTGWIITGTGFDTEIIPLTAAKQPVGLGASDNLQVPQGGWIDVRGDDYRADSLVKAFLVPMTPQSRLSTRSTAGTLYIGSFDVDRRGTINGQVYVPLYASAGTWVLQLVGQENTSTLRTTNLALTIIDATPGTETFLTQRAGFFQGQKAVLSAKGKKKLRALLRGIPEGATLETITITGVSVSKNTTQANLKLASQRADTIATYLNKRGLSATIDVAIYTQITIGSERSTATTPQPLQTKQGKPLTTTSITYQITD